jgi:hypothetical protein
MNKKLWNSEDLLNSRGLVSCGVCLAVYGKEGHNCEKMICQLCGGTIEDITAGAVVLPWGDTCGECMKEIQTTKEGK